MKKDSKKRKNINDTFFLLLNLLNIFFVISCKEYCEDRYICIYHSLNNIQDPELSIKDSLNIKNIKIKYKSNNKNKQDYKYYIKVGNTYYSIFKYFIVEDTLVKFIKNFYEPTLILKDTSYVFNMDTLEPHPFLPPGMINWKFEIKKNNKYYYISKQIHRTDTVIYEIHYNRYFDVIKLKYIYKKDTLIFIKEKICVE